MCPRLVLFVGFVQDPQIFFLFGSPKAKKSQQQKVRKESEQNSVGMFVQTVNATLDFDDNELWFNCG